MPRTASVDLIQNPRPRQRTVSAQEAFIARNANREDSDSQQIVTADGAGTAVHTRPGTTIMYKPSERNGYIARTVSVSAIPVLFKQGWHDVCPDCNGHHVDRNGNATTDPNACAGRDPVAVRVCPVCRKRIYDNMSLAAMAQEENDDPNVIQDEAYNASTPEQRTKMKLDLHLWTRHAEWAQANGVPPLPAAFKEMVDQLPAGKGT